MYTVPLRSRKLFFLLYFLASSINFSQISAVENLTDVEINQKFADVIDNHNQPKNGPNSCFRFQQFIKRAVIPFAPQQHLENAILSLRNLYKDLLPNNIAGSIHLISILKRHLSDVKFLSSKLLEVEIRFLNQFILPGAAVLNSPPHVGGYQDIVDNITANFSQMVGKITLSNGSVTGTIIPLPIAGGGHQWVVLTCGHIMDCLKLADNPGEAAFFTL